MLVNHHRYAPLGALLCLCLLPLPAPLLAQLSASSDNPLTPGSKPTDPPAGWKRFVGIYEYSNNGKYRHTVVILERNQRAYMHYSSGNDEEIHFDLDLRMMFVTDPVKGSWGYEIVELPGTAAYFFYLMESYVRTDTGPDPKHFFHVTPSKPLDQLRAAALAAKPPAEPGPSRKPDLVELATLDPSIRLDIRYAQSNNFLFMPIYSQARAFLQRRAAEALLRVLHERSLLATAC